MERLTRVGAIAPKHASEIPASRLGIGFEKLDRDVFDPEKAYDKVAATGAKWVRLQSGWQRTERQPGQYHFAWLDAIVDNLRARGMIPWICLCYGNDLYTEAAKSVFGAVGCPPIRTEIERAAWRNYVRAIAAHFRGRVTYYEVWNEADGKHCWKHGVSAAEYGQFVVETAEATRAGDPDARIIGGATCSINLPFFRAAFDAGMGRCVDAVSFHRYNPDETVIFGEIAALRALCDEYNPAIELIQGESGCPSVSHGAGALCRGAWTETKQAKYLLRHRVADFACGLKFTSHFTSVDMIEALNGVIGDKKSYLDYGYFGVLSAEFDEDGHSTGDYSEKRSYRAFQNLCSLMTGDVRVSTLPIKRAVLPSPRMLGSDFSGKLLSVGFARPNGSTAFAYWHSAELLSTDFESTVSFYAAKSGARVRLIDLMDGSIYALPESMLEQETERSALIKNLPVRDVPLLLAFDGFEEG